MKVEIVLAFAFIFASFKKVDSTFKVENTVFTSQRLQDSGIYILFKSADRFYIFPALRTRNKSRKELFLKQYYFAPGFHAEIPFSELDKGTYDVALIRQDGDETGILFRDEKVTIPASKKTKVKVNW